MAARYLAASGLRILERNACLRGGELDLIALDATTLVFVEVRTRRARSRFAAEATVGATKQATLIQAASRWLVRHGPRLRRELPEWDGRCRFDVVAVRVGKDGFRFRHLRAAFVEEVRP